MDIQDKHWDFENERERQNKKFLWVNKAVLSYKETVARNAVNFLWHFFVLPNSELNLN